MAWCIWFNRNKLGYGEGSVELKVIVGRVVSFMQEYLKCMEGEENQHKKQQTKWKAPEQNFYKTNFDGALFENQNTKGTGVVVRDARGNFIAAMRTIGE